MLQYNYLERYSLESFYQDGCLICYSLVCPFFSFAQKNFQLRHFWRIEGDSQNWYMNEIFGGNKLLENGTSFLVWTSVFLSFCWEASREKETETRCWLDPVFSYLLLVRRNIKGALKDECSGFPISILHSFECSW